MRTGWLIPLLLAASATAPAAELTLHLCRQQGAVTDTYTGKEILLPPGTTFERRNRDGFVYQVALEQGTALPVEPPCIDAPARSSAQPASGDTLELSGGFKGPRPSLIVTVR